MSEDAEHAALLNRIAELNCNKVIFAEEPISSLKRLIERLEYWQDLVEKHGALATRMISGGSIKDNKAYPCVRIQT